MQLLVFSILVGIYMTISFYSIGGRFYKAYIRSYFHQLLYNSSSPLLNQRYYYQLSGQSVEDLKWLEFELITGLRNVYISVLSVSSLGITVRSALINQLVMDELKGHGIS